MAGYTRAFFPPDEVWEVLTQPSFSSSSSSWPCAPPAARPFRFCADPVDTRLPPEEVMVRTG
jgi:hypothetical protein